MKRKYRYDHKTKKWNEVFRFNTDIHVISGFRKPDGSFNSFSIPRSSPLADYYLKHGA